MECKIYFSIINYYVGILKTDKINTGKLTTFKNKL